MKSYLESLKDATVVAKIQKLFGVEYADNDCETPASEEHIIMIKKVSSPIVKNMSVNNNVSQRARNSEKANNDAYVSRRYLIKHKFWYFLFFIATYVGDDVGYGLLFPFVLWNLNSVIARKTILVWAIIMYIGQVCKDIICWSRPSCPPVIRLQTKWQLEYGMPSTHAMLSVLLPCSFVFYTITRYEYELVYGIALSVFCCILISLSRLYLGMHTVLDVLAGIILSALLLIPLLPICDTIGDTIPNYTWTPLVLIIITVALVCVYPAPSGWNGTKRDTVSIVTTCAGVETGNWFNRRLNFPNMLVEQVSFMSTWPMMHTIVLAIARSIIGYLSILLMFAIFAGLFKVADYIVERTCKPATSIDGRTKHRPAALDLSYQYVKYFVISFNVSFIAPYIFYLLNISRINYYKDV